MKNKKGLFIGWIFQGLVLIMIIIAIFFGFKSFCDDYEEYKVYKDFCEDKPNFCYCKNLECAFNTKKIERYENGVLVSNEFSEQTEELCKIALELNDRKVLFEVGCEI